MFVPPHVRGHGEGVASGLRSIANDFSLHSSCCARLPSEAMLRWNWLGQRSHRDLELAMRFALIAVVTLTLCGCSGEMAQQLPTAPGPPVPTAPAPPPPTTPTPPARPSELTAVWVVVLAEGSALCIPGATVEIVRGHGLGRSVMQTTRGCSWWEPDYDAFFDGLNSGEELTLRASASGYASKEITVDLTSGWGGAQWPLNYPECGERIASAALERSLR